MADFFRKWEKAPEEFLRPTPFIILPSPPFRPQVKVVRVEISSSTSANHNPAEEDEEEAGGGDIWDN